MPIEFSCLCGKKMSAREDMAGKRGVCKQCGVGYTIPSLPSKFGIQHQRKPAPVNEPPAAPRAPARQPVATPATDTYDREPQEGIALGVPLTLYQRMTGGGNGLVFVAVAGGVGAVVLLIASALILKAISSGAYESLVVSAPRQAANTEASGATSAPRNASERAKTPDVDNDRDLAGGSTDSANVLAPPAAAPPAAAPPASGVADATKKAVNSETDSDAAKVAPDPWTLPLRPAGYQPPFSIPLENRSAETILFPIGDHPVAMIGASSWNLATGKRIGTIGLTIENSYRNVRAVSPDGKLYADAEDGAKVDIWSFESGLKTATLNLESRGSHGLKFLAFTEPLKLLTGNVGFNVTQFQLWDLSNGQLLQNFNTESVLFGDAGLTISQNGGYLAMAVRNRVLVYDVQKGGLAAQMEPPPPEDALPPLSSVAALQFSPDGTELAALASHGKRLYCWNAAAKLVVNRSLELDSSWAVTLGYDGPRLLWSPRGNAWMINGHVLVDRATQRPLWILRRPWLRSSRARFLDQDTLAIVRGGHSHEEFTTAPIPWAKLLESAAAMKGTEPAHIRPGSSLTAQVKIGEARLVDANQAKPEMLQVVHDKLRSAGLEVKAAQPVILLVYYSEKAGADATAYERRNPFDFRGVDSGRRVEDTAAVLQVSLWENGAQTPLWKSLHSVSSSRSYHGGIGDRSSGDSTFANAMSIVRGVYVPYFYPKDPKLIALPAVTDL